MTVPTLTSQADFKNWQFGIDAQGNGVYVAGALGVAALVCVCALLWPARRELIPILRPIPSGHLMRLGSREASAL
jgi:hypothetical protein